MQSFCWCRCFIDIILSYHLFIYRYSTWCLMTNDEKIRATETPVMFYYDCLIMILEDTQTSAPWRALNGQRLNDEQRDLNILIRIPNIYPHLSMTDHWMDLPLHQNTIKIRQITRNNEVIKMITILWKCKHTSGPQEISVIIFLKKHHNTKNPFLLLFVSAFALCHCQPQWLYMGMEGFHGFHLQIDFNLLKQIFSQAHKSFIFFPPNRIFQLLPTRASAHIL